MYDFIGFGDFLFGGQREREREREFGNFIEYALFVE